MHLEVERKAYDQNTIANLYEQSANKIEGIDALKFVGLMAYRTYMEWCMSADEGRDKSKDHCSRPRGKDLTEWIDQETHYFIGRRERRIVERPKNEQEYLQLRALVLLIATQSAIALFNDWKGHAYPPEGSGDNRNLRSSLDPESPMMK